MRLDKEGISTAEKADHWEFVVHGVDFYPDLPTNIDLEIMDGLQYTSYEDIKLHGELI